MLCVPEPLGLADRFQAGDAMTLRVVSVEVERIDPPTACGHVIVQRFGAVSGIVALWTLEAGPESTETVLYDPESKSWGAHGRMALLLANKTVIFDAIDETVRQRHPEVFGARRAR